jgi:hypothetical protein
MTDAVAVPSAEYNAMSPHWALTATLRAGTEARIRRTAEGIREPSSPISADEHVQEDG